MNGAASPPSQGNLKVHLTAQETEVWSRLLTLVVQGLRLNPSLCPACEEGTPEGNRKQMTSSCRRTQEGWPHAQGLARGAIKL